MGQSGRIPLLIVGGGIGGLATALAVSRAGYPAHVLERAEEFAEIGAGLQLAPNATRALDRLGVWNEIRRHAIYPKRLIMMDALTGRQITALDVGPRFVEHFGFPYIVMHRGDLLGVELDACRASSLVTLENDRHVVKIEDLGDGARVHCADGSRYECDALVGADGLWSTSRKLICDDQPICAQAVAYRATLPFSELPAGSDTDNMTIWVGPNVHFVQYTIRRQELFNQVAVFRSDRYRPDSDDWGTPQELDQHFAPMCARVREGVAKMNRGRRWAMFDRLPIPNWTRHRMTLLGDAAHPMLQYIAQGACQALEDAVCLGHQLRQCGGDVDRAFRAYQQSRLPYTARVQNAARFGGELYHAEGLANALRNELLGRCGPDDYGYLQWLYGHDSTRDSQETRYEYARR